MREFLRSTFHPRRIRASWALALALVVPSLDWVNPYFASTPSGACGNWIIGWGMYELARYAMPVLLTAPLAGFIARFTDDRTSRRPATWGVAVVALAMLAAAATASVPDASEWDRLLGYPPWAPVEHNVARRVPGPDGVSAAYVLQASLPGPEWDGEALSLATDDGPALEIARDEGVGPILRLVGGGPWEGTWLSEEPRRMAIYRVEGGWLVTAAGWDLHPRSSRVVLRGQSGLGPVSAAAIVPTLGAPRAVAWLLAAALPAAGLFLFAARMARRRLVALAGSTSARLVVDASGLANEAVTAEGAAVALRPPLVVGPGVGFVLVRPDEQAPTYRDDTRPRASAIEMTEEDGSIHLAHLRSQIARLEALAVLVTIVLATPAAVAAARGLTVSLGLV